MWLYLNFSASASNVGDLKALILELHVTGLRTAEIDCALQSSNRE